jgi:molybdate transport system substrate-binding protein
MPLLRILATLLASLGLAIGHAQAGVERRATVVFAAASLTDVLGELADRYQKETGRAVKLWFASSATLARQLESGADADVFLSADPEWMDYAAARGLVTASGRADLLGNRLVLVAPADSHVRLALVPRVGLRAALGDGRLATGDPDSVPAGRYAKLALTTLGAWAEVEDRLVRAENVRSALAFVARGEAPLGIVYATDARADRRVRIVDVFPETSHPPITYPLATTPNAGPDAAAFVAYLRSAAAANTFRRYGFSVIAGATAR